MAKLGGLIRMAVDSDGAIFFRQPTTEEWNIFRDKSTEAIIEKDYKREMDLTAEFFDLLFERAEVVVVDTSEGDEPLSRETLEHMPMRNKYSCVNAAFMTYRIFIPKN